MATSTSNLLQICNEVLLNVGERQCLSFNTPTCLKVKQYVLEALKEFETRDDWEFLRQDLIPTSWVNQVAILPNHQRIHNAYYLHPITNTYVYLSFLDRQSFTRERLTPFTTANDKAVFPMVYTIFNDGQVGVNPYPNDTITRGRIIFQATSSFTLPSLATDFLPIPERFTPFIVRLASSFMAARHLDDADSAQMFRNEFESTLQVVRAREQLTTTKGTNMYRRRVWR